MSRMIFCSKLQKEAQGFDVPPYPGALGQRIYESISQEAWQQWREQQIKYINEYRLNMLDAGAHTLLEKEMTQFLFGE